MFRFGLAFLLLSLSSLTACNGRDGARDAGDATRSLVGVQLTYTRQGAAEPRFDAQAHFVRYRSFDPAGVPALLGLVDFDGIPADGCRVTDGKAALDEALALDSDGTARGVPSDIALLDAGHLELRGPIDRAVLRTHHYPELLPFVSGVVYGSDEASLLSLGLGQTYQVIGEGGDEVGPFAAQVTAPRAFPSLSTAGGEPLRRGAELGLQWTAPSDGTADTLLLEVSWSSRQGARAVRCRARDDGEFTIPGESFDGLVPGVTGATLTATRQARAPLYAVGAGRGELSVALRDVAVLQVAP